MRLPLLPAIALVTLPMGAACGQQMLDDAQIRRLLAGKSALFSDYSVATYGDDGSYSYVAANNLYFKGKYTISDGKLCLAIDNGLNRCDGMARDGHGVYLLDSAGQQLRLLVRDAIVMQTVTTLCGVRIAYTIRPPTGNVASNVAAFSGTWLGKWDYGMCAALVVENVQADGTATVIYVNGSYGLENGFKAGSWRFLATINRNRLSDGGKTTSFEAVMKAANELSAARVGPSGIGTARFVRIALSAAGD